MRRGLVAGALAALALAPAAADEAPAKAASGAPPRGAEAVRGPAPLRIGLDRLRAVDIAPALAGAIEDRVCAALVERRRDAAVICPADVAAAATIARQAAIFGECRTDECMGRVDALRAADLRVGGAVTRAERGVVLSLQLSGPDGAGPLVAATLPAEPEALLARVPEVVRKLFP